MLSPSVAHCGMAAADELLLAQPVIEGRLYFCALKRPDALRTSPLAASAICYCIDDVLLYEPFFADFGPLNLGRAHRFCRQTQELLQEAERTKKRLYYYCRPHQHNRANAAVLVGIFQVIYLNRSAEEAFKPLAAFKPYVPFRDASCGVSTFHLTVMDVIKGIQKARDVGFLDWNSGSTNWSLEEYEHYEQVENGDLNWILPGKLVAFSGPANRGNEIAGYRLHTPEDYWDYYRKKGVTAVVRLNKKVYDRQRFTAGSFRHYDLYFPDGSCPSEAILLKWLEIAESEPGALAVHCKAGLGRTGVLLCSYIMKHFKFTAEEVIGYIRVCRPGSVIGPQQNFIRDVEARMWHEGDVWRATRGIQKPHLALGDLVINGKSAGLPSPGSWAGSPTADSSLQVCYSQPSTPNGSSSNNAYGQAGANWSTPTNNAGIRVQSAHDSWGMGQSTPSLNSATYSSPPYSSMKQQSGPAPATAAPGLGLSALMPSTSRQRMDTAASVNNADLSLLQYKQQNSNAGGVLPSGPPGSSSHTSRSHTGLSVQVPPNSFSGGNSSGGNSASTTPTSNGNTGGRSSAPLAARYMGRSTTPMRFTGSTAGAAGAHAVSMLSSSTTSSPTGGMSIISGIGGYMSRLTFGSAVSRSTPAALSGGGRAPSADRSSERASAMRSTIHTDTLRSANERLQARGAALAAASERTAQSADVSSAGNLRWGGGSLSGVQVVVQPAGQPIPTTPKAALPGHRPNAGVARTLAPNGQPRKIPMAMLPQYHTGLAHRPVAVPGSPLTTAHSILASGMAACGPGGSFVANLSGPDAGRMKSATEMRYGLHSK